MSSNKVFAPVIFFIAAREALEASLVMGTLEGMLEQLVGQDEGKTLDSGDELKKRETIKRMRKIVLSGAFAGLFVSLSIGAAFLAVFYTQVNDLFAKAEELWEGIFNLIAVVLITPMALAILRASKSRAKWQQKLELAFNKNLSSESTTSSTIRSPTSEKEVEEGTSLRHDTQQIVEDQNLEAGSSEKSPTSERGSMTASVPKQKKNRSWLPSFGLFSRLNRGMVTLFMIPFVTTLREGLEGVVFIGGVSLSLPATSIPLAAIVGIVIGLAIGFAIFKFGNVLGVRMFLLFSTGFLLLLSAGMASRAVYFLQFHSYVALVGEGAAESGSGPGSYNARGYIWHFNCCNPEIKTGSGQGWGVLNSLVGWNNTATYGSIFMYVGYWIAVSSYLWYCMWKEGRLRLSWRGRKVWESARARRMAKAKQAAMLSDQ